MSDTEAIEGTARFAGRLDVSRRAALLTIKRGELRAGKSPSTTMGEETDIDDSFRGKRCN
jgi:hypothetical protein